MSNGLTGYSSTKTGEISTDELQVLKTLEIRYDANGQLYCCSHEGWTLNECDEKLVQCRIFSRGNIRIKVAVYEHPLEFFETFAAFMCVSLIEQRQETWRHIDLRECDR